MFCPSFHSHAEATQESARLDQLLALVKRVSRWSPARPLHRGRLAGDDPNGMRLLRRASRDRSLALFPRGLPRCARPQQLQRHDSNALRVPRRPSQRMRGPCPMPSTFSFTYFSPCLSLSYYTLVTSDILTQSLSSYNTGVLSCVCVNVIVVVVIVVVVIMFTSKSGSTIWALGRTCGCRATAD